MDLPKTFKPGDHVASLSFVLVFIDGSSLKGAWHERDRNVAKEHNQDRMEGRFQVDIHIQTYSGQ